VDSKADKVYFFPFFALKDIFGFFFFFFSFSIFFCSLKFLWNIKNF
jgi:quinol-cytochrome oxidoreductase complex cytochrome b subunit